VTKISPGPLSKASTSADSRPLQAPVLGPEDEKYGEQLVALSDKDMRRLARGLLDLKPSKTSRSFDEIIDDLGL
jgi:hypothetical protein